MTSPDAKRGRGRPRAAAMQKLALNVMLAPVVAEQLRAYGNGNLSAGIARAAATTAPRLEQPTKAAGGVARPVGRPPLGEPNKKRVCVTLYADAAKQLRQLGDGNLSGGIERAAIAVRGPMKGVPRGKRTARAAKN